MTADEFRKLALALPEVEERSHMQHPDFRVRNRIFATLGYPEAGWGVVKLTPGQQEAVVAAEPGTFEPARGAWGRAGMTCVRLAAARRASVRELLQAAWRNAAPPATASGTSRARRTSRPGARSARRGR